jgi:RNase P subunit RPR2
MTWFAAHFNHVNVTASCFSCHNGSTATGKGAQHVQSSNACENCHSPGSWQNAHFNHVNVTASCFSCHNGSTATGKGAQHIQSSNTCEDCHSPGSWLNVRFDHAQVMGDCGSCHASDFKMDAHKKVDSPTIFYTATELRDCTGACHFYTDSSFTTILERRSGEHGIPPAEW